MPFIGGSVSDVNDMFGLLAERNSLLSSWGQLRPCEFWAGRYRGPRIRCRRDGLVEEAFNVFECERGYCSYRFRSETVLLEMRCRRVSERADLRARGVVFGSCACGSASGGRIGLRCEGSRRHGSRAVAKHNP